MRGDEAHPGQWQQWLNASGVREEPYAPRQRFDHFYFAYSPLIDGLGFAIGPLPTLDRDLNRRAHRSTVPGTTHAGPAIPLPHPQAYPKTAAHRKFETWLLAQGKEG